MQLHVSKGLHLSEGKNQPRPQGFSRRNGRGGKTPLQHRLATCLTYILQTVLHISYIPDRSSKMWPKKSLNNIENHLCLLCIFMCAIQSLGTSNGVVKSYMLMCRLQISNSSGFRESAIDTNSSYLWIYDQPELFCPVSSKQRAFTSK